MKTSDEIPGSPSKLLATCTLLLAAATATAQRAPEPTPLHALVRAPTGYTATAAPQAAEDLLAELSPTQAAAAEAFLTHNPTWRLAIDRRSGAVALAEGRGIPWLPGSAVTVEDLERLARAFVVENRGLLPVPEDQLIIEPQASRRVTPEGEKWTLSFRQEIAGVPVADSHLIFRVADGRLVQLGSTRLLPEGSLERSPQASLSVAEARTALLDYIGGAATIDRLADDGTLQIVLRASDSVGGSRPRVGAGWQPQLVYRFRFVFRGALETWEALVDANTGEVLRFVDATRYDSVVKASVYTRTNCVDPLSCVPGSIAEVPVTVPDALLTFVGGSCPEPGGACYTNSAGGFDYPAGASAAIVNLEGRYFRTIDACGPVLATATAPDDVDLGTTEPLDTTDDGINTNTDCVFANRQSEPASGTLFGGLGDTHAARNMYYHLNLINQKARFYLPDNEWLKGVEGSEVRSDVLTNVPPACNAFWSGATNSLVFMRVTPVLDCNNTGEIPDVALHEFGHGLDQFDATGTAPESGTGEAMGDSFALLQGQASCIGTGLRLAGTTGYGDSSSLACSGVRDLDYTRFCWSAAGACVDPVDPDAPNGSRSGSLPPPEPAPDEGTPARWNHMIDDVIVAPPGVADGYSNFYDCGGPETTGCAGALNRGCHCESLIASQANWDLVKLLVSEKFGGSVYEDPQGPAEVSGWQYMDRLWYLTRDLAISAYSVVGDPTSDPPDQVTTNGCGVSDWYSTYRFIDDDDADLSNGTPHAELIFAAFDLHAMACGSADDPQNQSSGCPPPLPPSTLGTCGADAPVQLTWSEVSGAETYRVLRNTLGCGFGFTPLAEVDGSRLYFEDSEVAPGATYYYSVQPVGANPSCYGHVSNCVAVTPSACTETTGPAPENVVLATAGDNRIEVTWDAVAEAASYKIARRFGGCDSGEPFEPVGVVAAPTTSFLDQGDLVGGRLYGYTVSASETSCASCTSPPSECVEIAATGTCQLPPSFAGLTGVTSPTDGACRLQLAWNPGTSACGTPLVYNVYGSTDPHFVADSSTLIASGIATTSYDDFAVAGGNRTFYLVRAEDGFGNTDNNFVKRYEIPAGQLQPGPFFDDAGDGATVQMVPSFFQGLNTWAVRPSGGVGDSAVFATTASGNYGHETCMSLETPTMVLGSDPELAFLSSYAIELGYDAGIVQVASASSGFRNWTKLDTVNYPGIMIDPLVAPACGDPGFDDLELAFTGTSGGSFLSFAGSLAAYAGQAVRIRFLFSSDPASNDTGWLIDDIEVTDAQLAGPCTAAVLVSAALEVDATASTGSDGNGVFESGESCIVAPGWHNVTAGAVSFTGGGTSFTGPPGPSYSIVDAIAEYGTVAADTVGRCTDTGDCYELAVDATSRPARHWDTTFGENLSSGQTKDWILHIGESFTDVVPGNAFYPFVETIFHHAITSGCNASDFCPAASTTRAQMAVFLLRGVEGGAYTPPACQEGEENFADVPASNVFCPWIEELARRQIASGCGSGNFCPAAATTRAQMAPFLLRSIEGPGYQPPECVAGDEMFADVPVDSIFCPWIEELARRQITSGCGGGNYCPTQAIPRDQMAVFLTKTYGLVLYGP